uniref:Serine/threonine-protein phosphatase 2A activator n=1 Tax=Macrostomum lignano TaxID=282301 RepID=A0A1I8ITV8_9PLAT
PLKPAFDSCGTELPCPQQPPRSAMEKLVRSPANMRDWERSLAYQEILGFIAAVSSSVRGKPLQAGPDSYSVSERCGRLNSLLAKLDSWIDEIPPVEQPARFGNRAFKTWLQRLESEAPGLLADCLADGLSQDLSEQRRAELVRYFVESFGNGTRIDYGTGHELAFVAFLCCLFKAGFLVTADCAAVALSVFARYLDLVRRLQVSVLGAFRDAGAEAGICGCGCRSWDLRLWMQKLDLRLRLAAHGVWCLDDFQFVPFIWGSAQLIGNPKVQPADIPNRSKAEQLAKENLFFGCLEYIFK